MIPTTVSSSPSTATISGTTGNNYNTSNNCQLNSFSTITPTSSSIFTSTISPQSTQTSSIMLGLAALILEGRAVADDEFQPQIIRTTAIANDANCLSGSGSTNISNSLHSYNTNNLLATSTSYGISGSGNTSGSGSIIGGGRQSPTCRPSTSRAAASFYSGSVGGAISTGHVINITTNPYAFNNNNNNASAGIHTRDARPIYIDPYTNSSSDSASSSAESTHQRWAQKLCQLRQVSPAASLSTGYEQPVTVEAREPELVALAINETGASERGDFEIIRRSLLNRTNLNTLSGTTATATNSVGAGSASSSPGSGSGSDNFLLSLQSLATTCLRSGNSPSIEPSGSGNGNSATGTSSTNTPYRYAAISSTPPQNSMYMYRGNTPLATHRFHDQQHGSASSCGSGVQSPRPNWSSVAATGADNSSILRPKEKYMRHVANTGLSLAPGIGRTTIPGTAVNTTIGTTMTMAATTKTINKGHTTKMATAMVTPTTTPTTASKYPQQGPHCDQFLKKMGLAKGEAAEAEDHICDSSNLNLSCLRWRAYCNKIGVIMGLGDPVCIEVYLGPVNHKILLEQWIITKREKAPPPTMTLPSLCSAIRSQLYFSQISAWCDLIKKSDTTIYDTGRIIFSTPTGAAGDLATPIGSATTSTGVGSGVGSSIGVPSGGAGTGGIIGVNTTITPGSSPNSHTPFVNERPRLNIYYRIKSFDSTACFNSKPNVHNFPNVNISENCSISICLKSLPRINGGIPKIGTPMLSNPAAVANIPSTTTMASTTTKVNINENNKTAIAILKATTASIASSVSSSAMTISSMETSQSLTASNGSTANKDSILCRNGNSRLKPITDTPRSSRMNRIAYAPSTSPLAAIPTTSEAAKTSVFMKSSSIFDSHFENSCSNTSTMSTNRNGTTNSNNCDVTKAFSNGKIAEKNNVKSNNKNCDKNGRRYEMQSHVTSCSTTNPKCIFFIGEEEPIVVDEADADGDANAEAFVDDDDDQRNSDTTNSSMDIYISSSGGNISHREKQLMKYRKRMLKRDKKQYQHNQHKSPQSSNNGCQPMEEGGDEYSTSMRCTATMLRTHSNTQIEMISTGTQTTPLSCCLQCGYEKTFICLRCNVSNENRKEVVIEQPTEEDVDDMDDSAASSISSCEIIRTPRNKAELLLQAIQRTPKVAASKHKKEQPRHPCGSNKTQNNNQLNGVPLKNGSEGGDNNERLNESSVPGCQVCKRQKMQHNFNNSNGLVVFATTNKQLADNDEVNYDEGASQAADQNSDNDIGDDSDNDDDEDDGNDGGKKYAENVLAKSPVKNRNFTTPLSVLDPCSGLMDEESFISSTKLTPQIDRCTLSSTTTKNSPRCSLLKADDRAGYDQEISASNRTGNRTPPNIATLMDGESFDESQFRTPTTTASNGNQFESTKQHQQNQQNVQKPFEHKHTPKPNLLHLHCNYQDDKRSVDNIQAAAASGDDFGKLTPLQNESQHGGGHNVLLLRKGLPKVNLTPIFCNPMPSTTIGTAISIKTSHTSSRLPIHGGAIKDDNTTTFSFDPMSLHIGGNNSMFCISPPTTHATPITIDANNIPVQKSYSAPTLPNSPSLSPRFAKQAAIYKRRSRHLSDRSDRSSLGSDEQFSDEDFECGGIYSPASSPLKQCFRIAAAFGRLPLLGNLEESLLQKRLIPKVEVMGFKVLLGASGGFCPTQLTIPASSYFYELRGETLSTPYMCEVRLPRKGYSVPRAGTVQATLLNPMGTVVRMFVIPYDMRDMPPLHQTFIRQRILAEASSNEATTPAVQNIKNANGHLNGFGACGDGPMSINNNISDLYQNNNNGNTAANAKYKYRLSPSGGLHGESNLGHFISTENMKRLRYSIHLRFQTSRSGRLSLHTDIRLLISRRTEYDTAAAHAKGVLEAPNDLITDTVMPTNPRYSARQDQSNNANGNGNGSSSITSTNINTCTAMTGNNTKSTSSTTKTSITATSTTNKINGSGKNSSKI